MILEKIYEIQSLLLEIKEEEDSCNEGSLSKYYEKIDAYLNLIIDLISR